jgi:hypothetical protein
VTPAQRRLVEAHRRSLTQLRTVTARQVQGVFDRLGSYDRADVPRFVNAAVPIVERSQSMAARLRAAMVARAVGAPVPTLDMQAVTGAAVRNGTPPEAVYVRPFKELWRGLDDGKRFVDARDGASQRAGNLADTDVFLASRQATVETGRLVNADRPSRSRLRYWQRVADGNACNFCLLASTQRYTMEDLMPLHDHCTCDVLPLTSDSDQVVDPDLLYRLRSEGVTVTRENGETYIYGEKATPNYDWESKVSPEVRAEIDAQRGPVPDDAPAPAVAIKEHGELGPVLVNPEHTFTGPADVPKLDIAGEFARLSEGYRDAAAEALANSRDTSLPASSRREFFDKAATLLGQANEYKRRSEQ